MGLPDASVDYVFTDPPFGISGTYEGHKATPESPQNVYRVDGTTLQATAVAVDLHQRLAGTDLLADIHEHAQRDARGLSHHLRLAARLQRRGARIARGDGPPRDRHRLHRDRVRRLLPGGPRFAVFGRGPGLVIGLAAARAQGQAEAD